jgi:LPXTG-motif cell wall-anchored protein
MMPVLLSNGYLIMLAGVGLMLSAILLLLRKKKDTQHVVLDALRKAEFKSETDLCWYVSHDVIGASGYDDCIVYSVDHQDQLCRQVAAFGPKNPDKKSILNPIQIAFGRGVVGSVALSGKVELIPDTTVDNRYVPDDDVRYSELTVPVNVNGTTRYIIDSEHKRRNRYKENDKQFFLAVSEIMSSKIETLSA